jgi:proton-translocating NADH-quinone oxidoreductase chain M
MLPLLLLIIAFPLLAAVSIIFIPKEASYYVPIIVSGIIVLITAYIVYVYHAYGAASLSFGTDYVSALGINLGVSVSNVTLILTVMTSIVFLAASLAGRYFITQSGKLYNAIFLLIEGSSLGVFLSSNLILLYVFWEISEISMFFIIFVYGGIDRRYASIKFIIYSLLSSLLLLIGFMLLYLYSSPHTFSIAAIESGALAMPLGIQSMVFLILLVSFMVKMPIIPFHTWLPDAHTEAPAPASMILAGVLLKFGGYGLILLFSILPKIAAEYSQYLAILFGISAIYCAIVAIRRDNLKRMIAYTSIVDMGVVAFGISSANSIGTTGAAYLMLSHGLAISILFLIAGVIDREFATLMISRIKGVFKWSRSMAYLFIFGFFCVIGLPLTAGFIADLMLFSGAVSAFGVSGAIPLASLVIIGAYFLWTAERSIWGKDTSGSVIFSSAPSSAVIAASILAVSLIIFGIFPSILAV